MILIAGIPTESPIQLLCEELDNRGIPYVMLNQRLFKDASLSWSVTKEGFSGTLTYLGASFNLNEFSGIYIRFMDGLQMPELKELDENHADVKYFFRFQEALTLWMEISPCRVVNRYEAMGSNNAKPYQAQIIRTCGFLTPDTLITNSPQEVTGFIKKHKNIIYKSISGVRSIVKKFEQKDLSRLNKIRNCPVQFQQCVEGFDVRAHVIGNTVIATRIETSGTDYRYANGEGEYSVLTPYKLPIAIKQKCIDLSKKMGLAFSGIDLRMKDSDTEQAWCFEVNPCPGYSYYQRNTGQDIAWALANYLCGISD